MLARLILRQCKQILYILLLNQLIRSLIDQVISRYKKVNID